MFDGRFGHDAVAKIENMGAALKVGQHALDLLVEAASAGDQREGIEIALKREPFRQSGDGGFRVRRRVGKRSCAPNWRPSRSTR